MSNFTHTQKYKHKNGDDNGKVLYKLINNAASRKKIENVRNKTDVRPVSNKKDYLKWTSKPSYMSHTKKFDMDFVAIRKSKD